jgi:hypothetical protein
VKAPITGIGLGLRMPLADELFEVAPPEVRWLEVHPENYMGRGGRYEAALEKALDRWPIGTHGLTMCFGSVNPFDEGYLAKLRALLGRVGPAWHSDHLCFAGADGVLLHDLIPLPFTREAVDVVVRRIREARDALGLPIAIENISWYGSPGPSEMDEATFHLEVLEKADCRILLDVNNVYVNCKNHGGDPREFIGKIPPERVVQYHVAGHLVRTDGLRIDTHAEPICDDVYSLFEHTLRTIGPRPTLLERDDKFPTFDALLAEVRRLDEIWRRVCG